VKVTGAVEIPAHQVDQSLGEIRKALAREHGKGKNGNAGR
jgi:hypothetical protein